MKNLALILLLCPVFLFCQTEQIHFSKKLEYEVKTDRKSNTFLLDLYYSPDGLFINTLDEYKDEHNLFVKSAVMAQLNVDLDKNASFLPRVDTLSSITFEKTKEKNTIAGLTCTYYKMSPNPKNFKICIAEDNPIDLLSNIPQKNSNLKGLILQFGEGRYMLTLQSIQEYSNYISLDFSAEKEKFQKQQGYQEGSLRADDDEFSEYDGESYRSGYKTSGEEEGSLAIDNLEEGEGYYWNGIPRYCQELDSKIPDFKNKELKGHVQNYAGQVCDMYLSFVEKRQMVGKKITLDLIRYEENYFRNTEFDKNDRKLLDTFLNNLD